MDVKVVYLDSSMAQVEFYAFGKLVYSVRVFCNDDDGIDFNYLEAQNSKNELVCNYKEQSAE